MPTSVLEAIKMGLWNYEPSEAAEDVEFSASQALPGTEEKLKILADRLRRGLPLWHPSDRRTFEDGE